MSLIEKIKADQLSFRKQHKTVEASVLTTLIGESEMIGKNTGNRETTDNEVVAVIKKFIKNIDETLGHLKDFPASYDYTHSVLEKQILEGYLPKQMSDEEIRTAMFTCSKELGKIMAYFKTEFPGMYDAGKVSMLAKEYIVSSV